jgi:Trk-type K+ transport system membrane component
LWRELSFDLLYILLGFFILDILERTRIQSGDPGFTMSSVLFNVLLAYGTAALSLGYLTIYASFAAEFGITASIRASVMGNFDVLNLSKILNDPLTCVFWEDID